MLMPLLRPIGRFFERLWDKMRCRAVDDGGFRCEGVKGHLFRHHIFMGLYTQVW